MLRRQHITDDEVRAWLTEVVVPSHTVWVIGGRSALLAMMVLNEP